LLARLHKIIFSLLFIMGVAHGESVMSKERVLKTYLSFSLPLDPAHVKTMADLNLSYALASTLVTWSPSRELISSLAESWSFENKNQVQFKLSPKAKWSDGSKILASQVVLSFERAKKDHGKDLSSLFDGVKSISAVGEDTVIFELKEHKFQNQIVRKLTEPMYGVLKISKKTPDLSVSSGPFVVSKASKGEILLKVNPHWISHENAMADSVVIHPSPKEKPSVEGLLKESWANVLTTSSLMSEGDRKKLSLKFENLWERSLDKTFFLTLGPKANGDQLSQVLGAMNTEVFLKKLLRNMTGLRSAKQFFPQGYVLHDPAYKDLEKKVQDLKSVKSRPLVVLAGDSWLSGLLKENLSEVIKEITGHAPVIRSVPLLEFEKERTKGDYDLLAGALPVNDPNVDGCMAFYFGLTLPIFPSPKGLDFSSDVKKASHLSDLGEKHIQYRKVFSTLMDKKLLLPLFHYSSLAVARDGIDLSAVPLSDETVSFAKVRFQ